MRKAVLPFTSVLLLAIIFGSCTLFSKRLDEKSGFSQYLSDTEKCIRDEKWEDAEAGRKKALNAWIGLKPVIQIDIDHDYVILIEDYLISLEAYIETRNKSEALSAVMLLRETWGNIGVM